MDLDDKEYLTSNDGKRSLEQSHHEELKKCRVENVKKDTTNEKEMKVTSIEIDFCPN